MERGCSLFPISALIVLAAVIILTAGCGQTPSDPSDLSDLSHPASSDSSPASSAASASSQDSSQTSSRATTVTLTIPEGYSMVQIFRLLSDNGVSDFDALMSTAQSYDYTYYPLIGALPADENRCFDLEGYLYPDTYEFYYNMKPQDAIGRFLRNSDARITPSMVDAAADLGYSMHEILTIASIIEKECGVKSEMNKISSIIHNRLNIKKQLQCDVTINYIERYVKGYIDGDQNRYNSFYNTYKCSALPSGPICSPGINAITAALQPASTEYLFFITDSEGKFYYAVDYDEHQANCAAAGIDG